LAKREMGGGADSWIPFYQPRTKKPRREKVARRGQRWQVGKGVPTGVLSLSGLAAGRKRAELKPATENHWPAKRKVDVPAHKAIRPRQSGGNATTRGRKKSQS